MKINFDGHFRDVIRLVNSPTEGSKDVARGFNQLLGELVPNTPQASDIAEQNAIQKSTLKLQDSSMMARYDFAEPAMTSPFQIGSEARADAVKIPAGDVKPPETVQARRVPSEVSPAKTEIRALINRTGLSNGIDPALSLAVAKMESSFNPQAVSSDGHESKGLFQLLDSTGKHLHSKLDLEAPYDPFNPQLNAKLGVAYLRYLHDIFSAETALPNNLSTVAAANSSSLEKLAVAAFNAGEGRVASAQMRAKNAGFDPSNYEAVEPYLPESTQQYVGRVLRFRDQFGGDVDGDTGRG